MNHSTASAAELAADHEFIQWVKYPSPERNLYWKNFADTYPDMLQAIGEARQLVLLLSTEEADKQVYDQDIAHAWQQIQQSMHHNEAQEGGRIISMWRSTPTSWISVAAVGLVLLVSAFLYIRYKPEQQVRYATAFGERKTIRLPDNSVVVLNANSVVTIPEKWTPDKPRKVILEGEAFFSVSHLDNEQQFIVFTAGGTQIDVIGTEFNVYGRSQESRIVLANGKVKLSTTQNGLTKRLSMKPGDFVSVTADARITRKQVDPALYSAWREDKVYFDDYTLQEVAQVLEQHYGYRVQFGNDVLARQRMTAFLEVHSPSDILTTISETFDVNITQSDNTIYIRSL